MNKKILVTSICALAVLSISAIKVETTCGEVFTTIEAPPSENESAYADYVEYINEMNEYYCKELGSTIVVAGDAWVVVHP